MDKHFIVQLIIIALLLYIIYKTSGYSEGLCINSRVGVVTDSPYSDYVNNNIALVSDSSLGAAPNGVASGFIGSTSPITNGQWALYQDYPLTSSELDNFDRSTLNAAAMAMPVYTGEPAPLPAQCTRV